jgi:hypothetical protein
MTNEERILSKLDEVVKRLDLVEAHLASISSALALITLQGEINMSALDDLTAQVQANTDAEQSAITLIQGLAAQIAANATDSTKISALAAQLKTSATALGAAIVANTPAAPATP